MEGKKNKIIDGCYPSEQAVFLRRELVFLLNESALLYNSRSTPRLDM